MIDNQTKSLAEQAATWLFEAGFVIYVVTGVTLLFYEVPAYKRFRTRALLLLVISSAFGLFVTIFDHTIGQKGSPNPNDWWSYYLIREITWYATVILGTVGSLMFLRDYSRLAAADKSASSSSSRSPEATPSPNDRNS